MKRNEKIKYVQEIIMMQTELFNLGICYRVASEKELMACTGNQLQLIYMNLLTLYNQNINK